MSAQGLLLEELKRPPVARQRLELVERKGKGHPDSICDAVAEAVSLALCREYRTAYDRILHHNTDKALLVAGRTQPRPGGGAVLEPMRLVLGDRAVSEYQGKRLDVGAIAEAAAVGWVRGNLRFVDPARHLLVQNELKEGSPELTDLFERSVVGANDTSAAVGYAPLTETERLVLDAEHWLNSPAFQQRFPEAGEDVKVMGVRRDGELALTVALAFVDRFVPDAGSYFRRKDEMRLALEEYLRGRLHEVDRVAVEVNTLDDPARGAGGLYLTVLGTSAEGGDCGQVGRGNRVNGVTSLNRPSGNEAAAGKNPVCHVGKIYSLLTHRLAERVVQSVPGVAEVYVWLCSQIGRPIDAPWMAAGQLILDEGVALPDIRAAVETIFEEELAGLDGFRESLARGELPIC
jgi:S-adenosylmethionine synthetase